MKRRTVGETVALRQLGSHPESTDSSQLGISFCGTRLSLVALGYHVKWEAPEVIYGMQPDFPCDIWAAGLICCEVSAVVGWSDIPTYGRNLPTFQILTSKLPFSENQSTGLTPSEPLERSLPEIRITEKEHVDNLCRLIEACLMFDPLKRPTIEHFEAEVQSMVRQIVPFPYVLLSIAFFIAIGRTKGT